MGQTDFRPGHILPTLLESMAYHLGLDMFPTYGHVVHINTGFLHQEIFPDRGYLPGVELEMEARCSG